MNKWLLRGLIGTALALPVGYALADFNITPGAGQTFFAFVCQTTKVCSAHVLIDSQGLEKGTTTNPVVTTSSSGTQPVSGNVGVSGTVTANQGTPNGTLANAWPMSITQGGFTANVNNAGRLLVQTEGISGGGGGGLVTQGTGNPANAWTVIPGPGSTTNAPWATSIRVGSNTAGVTAGGRLQVDTVGTTTLSNSSVSITGPVTTTASAPTTGGCTPAHFLSAASNNARSVKSGAGTLCSLSVINTSASNGGDLRLYDVAGTPTCSSATGVVLNWPIQTNAVGPGFAIPLGPYGMAFTNGIGICLTANNADNDNSNAATGINVNYAFK